MPVTQGDRTMHENETEAPPEPPRRIDMLRDMLVFQAKLAVDGLLDFVLIPASMGAGIVSLLARGEDRDAFYRVVDAGSRADRWINLFGVRHRAGRSDQPVSEEDEEAGMDAVVRRVEDYLLREYQEGRLPGPARGAIDRVVARLREQGRGGDR